ncbi:MAG: MFS transporter [Candidatus Diapherotrites archaeon]|nr:MFS transporter [Candidatus Diapherotrites archaeon]MDZ4255996.1 MFS transporter [archaeon]
MEPYTRITLVFAVFSMAVVLVDPIFALYLTQEGYGTIEITVLLSAFALAGMVAAPLLGGMSDHWGRRPIILAGILFAMIAYSLYAFINNPIVIFLARILEGIAYVAVILAAIAKMEDIVVNEKTKKASTRVGMSLSIGKIGHVVGPLLGGIIATYYGIISPFLAAVIVLGIIGIWYFFQKHNTHPIPKLRELTFNPIPLVQEFWKNKPLRGLSALVITHQFSISVLFVFLPLFMVKDLGYSIELVGIALFVKEVPQLIQFLAGKLTDSWGSKHVVILGTTLCGVSMVALSFFHTFDWILVALFVYGMGGSLMGISTIALLSGFAEQTKQEGSFLGSHVAISRIGAFLGFIISGIVVQLTSIPTLFAVAGTLILVGIVIGEEYLASHTFYLPKPKHLLSALFHHR